MIEIIDLLKPKNGGSFKLLEAIDIDVEGYSSLADAVTHFATDVMIEAINVALSGKASQADLTALEAEVDTKADSSDLTTATANLQTQIDNIVSGSTADSEVINARVDADGNSNTTLKARSDADYTNLLSGIAGVNNLVESVVQSKSLLIGATYQDGYYLNSSGQLVAESSWTTTRKITLSSTSAITLTGVTGYFLAFYQSNDTVISVINNTTVPVTGGKAVITVPTNAAKFALSVGIQKKNSVGLSYINFNTDVLMSDVKDIVMSTSFDANNAKDNAVYRIQATSFVNKPSDYPTSGKIHFLLTLSNAYSGAQKTQIIFNSSFYPKWRRTYYNSWSNWQYADTGLSFYENALFEDPASALADLNDAKVNRYYVLQFHNTPFPDHTPYTETDKVKYLLTYEVSVKVSGATDVQKRQFIYNNHWELEYSRQYTFGSWSDWTAIYNDNAVVECGTGKKYTRLRDAIAKGCEMGCKVIVYPGTYDLTTEFATEITAATGNQVGIKLENGVNVEFMAGAYVTAEFDGSSDWVTTSFSPFYTNGSFTLENANIKAANCRYCVHDEMSGSGTYTTKYINCRMEYSNTRSSGSFYTQCIGGGLGLHGSVIIDGGYYKSSTTTGYSTYGTYGTAANCQQPISFHNGLASGCDSKIVIKNVYLADRGYFRFGNYGDSTIETPVEISNCSTGLPTLNMFETAQSENENFSYIAFNNHSRNEKVEFDFSRVISIFDNSDEI